MATTAEKQIAYEKKLEFIAGLYCAARQCADETGCSWQLILAQAAQETGWGARMLPGTNNVFNIKASADWKGPQAMFRVWEVFKGKKVWVMAPFRIYPNYLESLRDRQKFLKENPRYGQAGLYNEGIKGDLLKEATALHNAGYASDPLYAPKLQAVFNGASMKRAIAMAQKQGCKGCLPTINVYLRDAARVELANVKVKATQGANTCELVTDNTGHVQVQATLSGGQIAIEVWSEHDRKWIAIEEKITPTSPPTAVTLVGPTLVVDTSTQHHVPAASATNASAAPAQHPAASHAPAQRGIDYWKCASGPPGAGELHDQERRFA
jgi:hypothetical protein